MQNKQIVAIDCEMIRTLFKRNALARVSIVNYEGEVLMDEYVIPDSKVLDYRSKVSGIKAIHLKNAITFQQAQWRGSVLKMIQKLCNCNTPFHQLEIARDFTCSIKVEDARSALMLYKKFEQSFERDRQAKIEKKFSNWSVTYN